jgi:Family of unknown function (DUF695)
MNFLKKIFGSRQKPGKRNNVDFWAWFAQHASPFHRIVKNDEQVDADFLEKIMPRLQSINDQFYCLTGMYDNDTAELIVTAEGDIKSFVFVEELIARAPAIAGWRFTALKPPTNMQSFSLNMNEYKFENGNIRFYYNEDAAYPDEINISLLYDHYTEENKDIVSQGCLLFLENSLGELNMATQIDEVVVAAACPEGKDPIPVGKLEDFLAWREKELVEKYEGARHDTNSDTYSIFEAKDEQGMPSVALINQDLLDWDAQASHPWMMVVEISFDGTDRNGMPDRSTSSTMDLFEDTLTRQLPDSEGYLNLGRETYDGKRTIYFACKEFRRSSKAAALLINQYQDRLKLSYDIYKDKYWMSLNRFKAIV